MDCECILKCANDEMPRAKTVLRCSKPRPFGQMVMHKGIAKDQRGLPGLTAVTIKGLDGLPPGFPFLWYSGELVEHTLH